MALVRVQLVRVDRVDAPTCVAHVVLSRPDKKNALTPAMLEELLACVRSPDVRDAAAVVLTGEAGAGGFCAGFDLKLCLGDSRVLGQLLTGLSEVIVALRALAAPVVIGAHGTAIAGGCALLGGADIVVASSGLRLGYPVVRLGISPAVSAPYLSGAVGAGRAREMLLEPSLISSARGREIGLIHELIDDDQAGEKTIGRALVIAQELAAKPATGLAATKRWLNELDGSADLVRVRAGLQASLALVGTTEQQSMLASALRGS